MDERKKRCFDYRDEQICEATPATMAKRGCSGHGS